MADRQGQISQDTLNAQLREVNKRQFEELSVLHKIATALTEARNIDELLHKTTEITSVIFPDDFGFLLVNEKGDLYPHASYHMHNLRLEQIVIPRDRGVVGWVARNGRSRRVPDVAKDPDYLSFDPQTASELCVPLKIGDQIIGVINTESTHLNNFSEADERLLITMSRQLATIIEKNNLLDAERRRRQEAETLRDTMAALTSTLERHHLLEQILLQLEKVVPNDTACLMLLRDDNLCIEAAHGFRESNKLVGQCFSAGDDVFFQEVQKTREPICLPDAGADPRFQHWGGITHVRGWICAPLIIQDRVIGVMTVDNEQLDAYNHAQVALAQAFANQAAIAIENARLYEAEQLAHHTAEIFRSANEALTQTLDPDKILETLIDLIVSLVSVDSASILAVDETGDHVQLHSTRGFEDWTDVQTVRQIRINIRKNLVLEPIFFRRQSVLIPNTATHPDWIQYEPTNYVRSWIGVPIVAEERVVGAISLDKATPHYFSIEHLRVLETLAAQASVALQNAQLFMEAKRRAAELQTITEISAALRLTDSVEKMMPIILSHATAVVGSVFSGLYMMEEDTQNLVIKACLPHDPAIIGHRLRVGEGITGHVAAAGEIYICEDTLTDPIIAPFPAIAAKLRQFRASISLPLQTQTRVIGVLHINVDHPHKFSPEEINLLTAISEIAAGALARAMLLETLELRVTQRTRELVEANERLQELDRLKSKFVSDVSHELRTPITNLTLYLDLLERGKIEHREKYQGILQIQVRRLNKLIEDTLRISRLDTGKTQFRLAPMDINQIAADCVAEFQPAVEMEGDVCLTAVLHPNLPQVLGDEEQIVIAIRNLLQNAVNYTSSGEINLTTKIDSVENRVCLAVSDTGPGIEADELTHIFERFYRGIPVSQSTIPGTGLGLAIAREIVTRHLGTIQVDSRPGKGSTFTICLPIARPGVSAA